MSIIFIDYGYLTILTLILTIIFCFPYKGNGKQFFILLLVIISLWLIGVFVIPEKDIPNISYGDLGGYRSNCEIFLGIGVSLFFVYFLRLLDKKRNKELCIFITISIPLQLFELFCLISYVLCEIVSFSIVIRKFYSLKFIGIIVLWIVFMFFCINLNWKGILPDLRANKICFIDSAKHFSSYKIYQMEKGEICLTDSMEEYILSDKYYQMRNAEDTHDRLIQTLEVLDSIDNCTIHFIADEDAAYSLLKSTLIVSIYGADSFSYDEKNTQSFIVKKDNGYFTYINYQQPDCEVSQSIYTDNDSVLLCADKELNMKCFSDCMNNIFSQNISIGAYRYLINIKGDTLLHVSRVDSTHYDFSVRRSLLPCRRIEK